MQHAKAFMLAVEDLGVLAVKCYVGRFMPRQSALPDNDGKCESLQRQIEVTVLSPCMWTAKQPLTWEGQCRLCSIILSRSSVPVQEDCKEHTLKETRRVSLHLCFQKTNGFACGRHLLVGIDYNCVLAFPDMVWEMTLSFIFLASSRSPPLQSKGNFSDTDVWCTELKTKFYGNLEIAVEFSMAFDERLWAKPTWALESIGTEWSGFPALLWI